MKKFVIAAVMIFASSTAFAGDSDALKNILKSKAYAEAESLLKSSLGQLADKAEKAQQIVRQPVMPHGGQDPQGD